MQVGESTGSLEAPDPEGTRSGPQTIIGSKQPGLTIQFRYQTRRKQTNSMFQELKETIAPRRPSVQASAMDRRSLKRTGTTLEQVGRLMGIRPDMKSASNPVDKYLETQPHSSGQNRLIRGLGREQAIEQTQPTLRVNSTCQTARRIHMSTTLLQNLQSNMPIEPTGLLRQAHGLHLAINRFATHGTTWRNHLPLLQSLRTALSAERDPTPCCSNGREPYRHGYNL